MAGYTRKIVVFEPPGSKKTMIANGAETYPGNAVTAEGETWPDFALPDAIGDSCFGIAGVPPGCDVDTVIGDNVETPIYLTGSGAIVYAYHKGAAGGGDVVIGDIMCSSTGATGKLIPLHKALAALVTEDTVTVLATSITRLYTLVGRAMETHTSVTTHVPIQVRLSI